MRSSKRKAANRGIPLFALGQHGAFAANATPDGQRIGHNLQAAVVQHRRIEVGAGARSPPHGRQPRGRSWQLCAPGAHCGTSARARRTVVPQAIQRAPTGAHPLAEGKRHAQASERPQRESEGPRAVEAVSATGGGVELVGSAGAVQLA